MLGTPFCMVHTTYVCVYSNFNIQSSELQSAVGHSLKKMEIKKWIYPAKCSLYQCRREVILLLWQTGWCNSTYVTLLAMKHLVLSQIKNSNATNILNKRQLHVIEHIHRKLIKITNNYESR